MYIFLGLIGFVCSNIIIFSCIDDGNKKKVLDLSTAKVGRTNTKDNSNALNNRFIF